MSVLLVIVLAIVITGFSGDDTQQKQVGRLTQMEQTGELHDMLEQHRQMIQRMQEDASPAMLDLMNRDPLWQMMRSPKWAELDRQHQEDIDGMLSK